MNLANLFTTLAQLETLDCLDYACRKLSAAGYHIDDDPDGNYAVCTPAKPNGVALVAHCDTVGKEPPKRIRNKCGVLSVKGGGVLGADDRAGVAAILAVVQCGYWPQIYLTTGEEVGGIGASELVKSDYQPPETLNVLIQIDRAGGNDFVTYDCESKALDKYCRKFGFVKDIGSFSDISVLCPKWMIAGANVSCGYYDQHRHTELLVLPQLQHTINRLIGMVAKPPQSRIVYEESHFDKWAHYRRRPLFDPIWETKTAAPSSLPSSHVADLRARQGWETTSSIVEMGDGEYCIECGRAVQWIDYDAKTGLCIDCESLWSQVDNVITDDPTNGKAGA